MCVLALWSLDTQPLQSYAETAYTYNLKHSIHLGLRPTSLTSSDVYFDVVQAFEWIKLAAAGLCAATFSSRWEAG